MPVKGYKSITVKQDVFDYLTKEYKSCKKEWLIKHGINSFTGYINYRLGQLMDEEEKKRNP